MSTSRSPSVLVVDDHLDMAQLIAGKLESESWLAHAVGSGRAALDAIAGRSHDLVITDLRMPDVDGFAVLEAAHRNSAVIVMTAFGDISTAVEAMRRGAWHFVEKPVRLADIVDHARRALVRRDPSIVGASAPMQALARTIERVARSRAHVLIRGESGTGKELVARAIHEGGPRAGRPFITVNCAAIPDSLVESELFGHTRGAFTGATTHRRGLFGEADGGTLFLDEIGEMPLVVQAKLLRALQGGEVRAVGADDTRGVDARVIAATNQDLEARVKEGAFRADLYYRLSVVPLVLPPLRDRGEDIHLLAAHLLAQARARNPGATVEAFAPDAMAALAGHSWPGNVRELEHVIERAVVLGDRRELSASDLRDVVPELAIGTAPFPLVDDKLVTLREMETRYIELVLKHCDSNKARAAEILGVDPSTLYRRARVAR